MMGRRAVNRSAARFYRCRRVRVRRRPRDPAWFLPLHAVLLWRRAGFGQWMRVTDHA